MSEYLPGNICERLRELREARGLDIQDVAEIIGIHRTTYGRIESGTASLSSEGLMLLSKYYDVPADYILGIVDVPDKTYFEIRELGLSVEAAKNLYSGKIDPRVINLLLINDKFADAIKMMSVYFSGEMSEMIKATNCVKDFSYSLINDLMNNGDIPNDSEMDDLKTSIRVSKESPNSFEIETIKSRFMQAVKEVKEQVDAETEKYREERQLLNKEIAKNVRIEMKKIQYGRTLPEAQRKKKIVNAIKDSMAIDPNMTPEMIKELTPVIEQSVETYAKYGKN
ncbi:Transcriptional regulator, contains XRE-family HTH domain [Pseudobutyrivibrio sp. ACV-2]|uniref:helix-turn-helix domain-containing protein n=1 Tax=Pseudobutyrivibrio sp. ACV-2 TaxID=1520801 RepID=UPI000899847D|nr:helix-turn-helix transcriptional regulator [Pseudobutyrivibrio sp. ACV-2]SEB02646.1 Transcriptional regulator, contains XRE-family HTH domain [Pseudobutyrivibrio sp. ACV-2]